MNDNITENDINDILDEDYSTIYIDARKHDWLLYLAYPHLYFLCHEDNSTLALICHENKKTFFSQIFHDIFVEYHNANDFVSTDKRVLDLHVIMQTIFYDNMSPVFLKPTIEKYHEWEQEFTGLKRGRIGISFYDKQHDRYRINDQEIQNFLSIVNVTKCDAIGIDTKKILPNKESNILRLDLSNKISEQDYLMDIISIIAHLDFIITCDIEVACIATVCNVKCWYSEDSHSDNSLIFYRDQIKEIFPNLSFFIDDEFDVLSLRKHFIAAVSNKLTDEEQETYSLFEKNMLANRFAESFHYKRNIITLHPMLGNTYKRICDFYLKRHDYFSALILLGKINRLMPITFNNVHNLAIIWNKMDYHHKMIDVYHQYLMYFIQEGMLKEKNIRMISSFYPLESLIEKLESHITYQFNTLKDNKEKINNLKNAKLLATCYFNDKQYEKASETYENIIKFDNEDSSVWKELALCQRKLQMNGKAIESYKKALSITKDDATLYSEFGTFLGIIEMRDEAVKVLTTGLKYDPNNVHILDSLGATLFNLDRFGESETCLKRALSLEPKNVNVMMNLAAVLTCKAQFENASDLLNLALQLEPDNKTIQTNLGIVLLTLGNYSDGWRYYSPRFEAHEFTTKELKFPVDLWDGDLKKKKHILIWCEQGLGDQLMFASLIPELLRSGMQISMDCDPRLVSALVRSFPRVNVLPKIIDGHLAHQALLFDCHVPNANVAIHLRQDNESFSRQPKTFLKSHPALKQKFKLEISNKNTICIGISWHTKRDRLTGQRTIALSDMLAIFKGLNVCIINLQYGNHENEIHKACLDNDLDILSHTKVDPLKELDNYIALMDACNLVITIDNSTAHFAGALGKPCWVLLPKSPNWRWLLKGEHCNWYNSLRLFRQTIMNDWSEPLNRARHLLHSVLRARMKNSNI